jgi:hypothetical protein
MLIQECLIRIRKIGKQGNTRKGKMEGRKIKDMVRKYHKIITKRGHLYQLSHKQHLILKGKM